MNDHRQMCKLRGAMVVGVDQCGMGLFLESDFGYYCKICSIDYPAFHPRARMRVTNPNDSDLGFLPKNNKAGEPYEYVWYVIFAINNCMSFEAL